MTNENCLKDIKCPKCGNEERFIIAASITADVTDDGAEVADHSDWHWDDASLTTCTKCDRDGPLSEFRTEERPMTKYFVTAWCDRPFYAKCEVDAETPQEALEKARTAIHDAPAEECDQGYPWDEWRVDTAEAEGVLLHSDVPQEVRAAEWEATAARAVDNLPSALAFFGEPQRELPNLTTLLWDYIENGESSYGLSFSELREKVRVEDGRKESH